MRIKKGDMIAGCEAKKIRDLFRALDKDAHFGEKRQYTRSDVELLLKMNRLQSNRIMDKLIEEGYIGKGPQCYFYTTSKGHSLKNASAKIYTREYADKMFKEFMRRVETINRKTVLTVHDIPLVIIFGSYATDVSRVGDIDIVFTSPTRRDMKDIRPVIADMIAEADVDLEVFDSNEKIIDYPSDWLGKYMSFASIISTHYLLDFLMLLKENPDMPYKIVLGDRETLKQQAKEIWEVWKLRNPQYQGDFNEIPLFSIL
jgi:predicted nucleotidyltransferase